MLAKLWKKILLAIVIIAILFNITSKIVRRYSLDEQLNSVVGGESLSKLLNGDKDNKNNTTDSSKINNNDKNSKENITNSKSNDSKKTSNMVEENVDDKDYIYYDIEDDESSQENVNDDEKTTDNEEEINAEFDPDSYFIDFDGVYKDYIQNWGF